MSRRLGVALAVAFAIGACGKPAATTVPTVVPGATFQPGPASPTSVGKGVLVHTQFATAIDEAGVPVGESDAFPVGTQQILALVAWDDADAGTQLRMRLFQDDRFVLEQVHVVALEDNAGFAVPLIVEEGFPAGLYTAEISWNGVPDELATFTVGDVPGPGVLIGSGEGTGPMPYAAAESVLVVTRVAALRDKLGAATDPVLAAARRVGDVHDLEADGVQRATPEAAAQEVQRLLGTAAYRYLLILGNDDVMPYFHVDNPMGPAEVSILEGSELPAAWVPSDDPYTDLDHDDYGVPDIATARIPSSEDGELLLKQLGDLTPPDGHAYALVNQQRRSQAAAVIAAMSPHIGVELNFAPPVDAARYSASSAADARYLYVLLHGSGVQTGDWAADLKRWRPLDAASPYVAEWTVESRTDDELIALNLENNRGSRGLVNVGACYGAWTLDTVREPKHKTADNNLALYFLKSGARAFVADTHLSYSIPQAADGVPLGRTGFERVFWRSIGEGMTLIDAFQTAKVEVAAAIPGLLQAGAAQDAAINLKTVHYMVFLGRP
ncbi:MAG: C25 family cysteine peptidase [Candidatus Limnocylindrales bacterium]